MLHKIKLAHHGVQGPNVRLLEQQGELCVGDNLVCLDDVSHIRKGDVLAVVLDTLPCQAAIDLAKGAKLLLCESTYLESHRDLAREHHHLTAKPSCRNRQSRWSRKTHSHPLFRQIP